ncbi:MAG TPA: ATP-binding protein [Thermoanaerobaculia bacterium]|nr:ATP-binding protein [Thermoanaerobaculia bacterium]
MRRVSQSTLLGLANGGLVLLTALALSVTTALLVRRLLAEQQQGRVELAAGTAARQVVVEGEELAVTARLLAERSTLQRLLQAGQQRELTRFLAAFRTTTGLAACAVQRGNAPWATAGHLPAELPPRDAGPRVERDQPLEPAKEGAEPAAPLLVAVASVPGANAAVVVARRLDAAFVARLSRELGLDVRLEGTSADEPPLPRTYLAAAPVPLPGAEDLRVVAALPQPPLGESFARLVAGYAATGVIAALAALLIGIVLGRRLAAPARRLAAAASRIGAGDLRTPVPAGGGAELARLGGTLEEMRRRLLEVTSELELREAEARAVLAGVVEGVLAVDDERRITYLNPQAERLLGTSADAARGRFCGDLLRPESSDGSFPCDDRCPLVHARSRGTSRTVELLRLPAGRRQVVLTSSAPSAGSQVMVLRDETEEEAGRRVRDVVLANLSHELKTPLAAQLASVELLRDSLAEQASSESAVLVGSLERSTLRLLGLVENLLASARLESGEWAMRSEPVDLGEVAREATVLLAPLFAQRGQRVEPPADELPWVVGDRTQLLQVVLNLLGNANKFAPEGSRVRVAGGRDGAETVLWVEDEGPGLPPGDSASLFGRFRRFGGGGGATGASSSGAGLGLWIVQSIVRRHGGTVSAETRPEGGARFTVRLPAPEVPAA